MLNNNTMSEFHPLSDDRNVPQSEALPTMTGGGASHVINEGDLNPNDSNTTYLANNPSNSNHHPHCEEMAAPSWGNQHPSANATYNNNHLHRAHHPPHGSFPHPHEPPHHHLHGGYHHPPPPHYAYQPQHDSHYHHPHQHAPPPPHPASVHHYPPKYNHAPQMYHPGYYHHPPPPQYHPQHHYSPHHHGMPPHGSYPPHYSTVMAPQEVVSPSIPRDDGPHPSSSVPPHNIMHNATQSNHPTVNMVTPPIYTASPPATTTTTTTTGGDTSSNATKMYTPNTTTCSLHNNSPLSEDNETTNNGDMSSPATKELFGHHLSLKNGKFSKKKKVHSSILCKGLLPLDCNKHDNDDDDGLEKESLSLPATTRYETTDKKTTETTINEKDESAWMSKAAQTAGNTAATLPIKTSFHQMAEIQSISNAARAQIAKMKKHRQVQQVESQRVADIACEDGVFDTAMDVSRSPRGGVTTNAAATTKKQTPRDKDGFIYYRRVGNKHYKKLFEKGLVPKDNDGEVEERVNANQRIQTDDVDGGVEEGAVPVVHLPTTVGEGIEEENESLQLPRRETQVLYSNDEKRSVKNSSDGYELRVIPHDDGNDFHVELIKPKDVEKEEDYSLMERQQCGSVVGVEENSSLAFRESEKVEESVEGSKKNEGEFDTAVDSILDAAETIAKRATPRSSPVSLPDSQNLHLPGVSSATKRKCEDMIQGYQEEKRQRSNSSVTFHSRAYPAPSTFSYPPTDTVRPSPPPPHETSSVAGPSPQSHASEPVPNNAYSQIICQDRKEKRGRRTYCYPHPSVDLTEYYSTRQVTKTKKEELTALALCAASHIQKEPVLFRAILLNMALERERYSPKKHSGGAPTHLKNLALKRLESQNASAAGIAFLTAVESSGKKVIRDGFFWKDVPELEKVLQKHMMEYYFMSENKPQSKKQQQFNNRLVSLVYQEAIARGFVFDPVSFSLEGHGPLEFPSTTAPTECAGNWIVPPGFNHKKLRDRIRCYYKTHVQNSKKRLGTLLKNPNKERNRDILLRLVNELRSQEHIELSSECVVALKRLKAEQDSIKGTVSTPDGTSPETSSRPSPPYEFDDHSEQTTTTPYSSRVTISDGGSGSSSSTSSPSVQNPQAAPQPESTMFSPFKHASLLSSMRQLDSQRH